MSQRTNHQDAFGARKPLSGGTARAVLAEKRGREAHSFAKRNIFTRPRLFRDHSFEFLSHKKTWATAAQLADDVAKAAPALPSGVHNFR
jgi:hypothetical protein